MHDNNVAFAGLAAAFSYPERIAFDGVVRLTHQRYADLSIHFARGMQRLGVDNRSTVGLAVANPIVALIAITAIGLLGAKWVHHNGRASAPRCSHVFTGSEKVVGGREFTRPWFEAPVAKLSDLDGFAGHGRGDDLWMIARSSGTTGQSKFIPISYDVAWQRLHVTTDRVDGSPMIFSSRFKADNYVGVGPRLRNLMIGGTDVNAPTFSQLQEKGVDRVMGSPAHIGALMRMEPRPPERRILSCRVTGSAVTRQFIESALLFFEEIQVLYASTEAGAIALSSYSDRVKFNGPTGDVLEGVQIEIVDGTGASVPSGTEGTIRVRSGWSAAEYAGDPAATAAAFIDGWFYPGDRGVLDSAGALHVAGRSDDVLNAGGTKLNATELDEVLQMHPDVLDGYCFLETSEQGIDVLSAVVSLQREGRSDNLRMIRKLAAQRLGPAKAPHRVYLVEAVLRNENGKPQRTDTAAATRRMELIPQIWP